MTASVPHAAGLAMEVPSISIYWSLRPFLSGTVETIPTPGAAHASAGPKQLNVARNKLFCPIRPDWRGRLLAEKVPGGAHPTFPTAETAAHSGYAAGKLMAPALLPAEHT